MQDDIRNTITGVFEDIEEADRLSGKEAKEYAKEAAEICKLAALRTPEAHYNAMLEMDAKYPDRGWREEAEKCYRARMKTQPGKDAETEEVRVRDELPF